MNIFKTTFLISCFWAYMLPIYSQQIDKWQARWIYHAGVQPQSEAVILFRKTLELTEKPNRFVIHISADNHYRLFVNGNYITRGPARGDLSHWFYETLDIAAHLKQGKNVVAVEVVNWGPKRSFTQFSHMTSLWVQGETDKEKGVNTEGGKWKCSQNRGHHFKTVDWIPDKTSVAFGLYVASPMDSIIAQKYTWAWQNSDFDDTNWEAAQMCDLSGGRDSQHAGGIFFSGGPLLVPRRTGLLSETKEALTSIVKSEGITANTDFLTEKNPLIIPAHSKLKIWIDQKYLTIGYPEMTVSGGKNAHIQVRYAETLFITNRIKGNRHEIDGKKFIGIKDVFMPDGGAKRLFKPSFYRAFRFIQLDITTQDDPLSIDSYFNVKCQAPIALKAKFETDDADLNKLMDMGWRTVSLCAQDMLLSDAYYEQMQYVGDSRVHNLTLLTLSGDDRLTRNALIQFDESRIPEGLTYACYPNPFHLIIPSYSLIYIDQLHDYMFWKGDKAYLEKFDLGITSVLDWFDKRLQANGLIGKVEWWAALAWPKGYQNGVPPEIEKGNNALHTLHYAYTLRHAADIFRFIGKENKAKDCEMKATRLNRAVKSLCFDIPKGLFKESPTLNQYAQMTNILAILSEAVKGKKAQMVMKKVLTDTSLTGKADLFLHAYLFEAMNKTGLNTAFFDEISEWRTMIQRGLTTFVEVPLEWGEEGQRSECHPWSSIPNFHFFRTVCGIRPTSAGHKTVEIAPELGHLKKVDAIYPHPLGNIEMNLRVENGLLKGTIKIPMGMTAVFKWKGKTRILKTGEQEI
jgi:hypothetical protein